MKSCKICGTKVTGRKKYCSECQRVKNKEGVKANYEKKKNDPEYIAKRKAHLKKYREKYFATSARITADEIQELVDQNYPTRSIAQRFEVALETINYLIRKYKIKKSYEYAHGGLPVNCKHYKYF